MRELSFRPRAALDVDSIQIFLVSCTQDWDASRRFTDKLIQACDKLCEFPGMGSAVESADNKQVRRYLFEQKYWLYYTFSDEELVVWRVLHAKKDIDDFAVLDL